MIPASAALRAMGELLGADKRTDAEWLLAHVLGCGRMEAKIASLREGQKEEALLLARRRAKGEPLQYIIGMAGFYGRDFIVTPDVLIPRMDTEALAEAALRALRGLSSPKVADVCTGSGILAITIALERPDALVTASDISPAALAVAEKNAARLKAAVRFIEGDLLAALPEEQDVILCNPPYIARGELAGLMPEVRDHEPTLALDGGEDGLAFYRRLAEEAPSHLLPNGLLALEIGDGQAEAVDALLAARGWRQREIIKDLSGMERALMARRPDGYEG